MGKHFISALVAIACALLAACTPASESPKTSAAPSAEGTSWEWHSNGALPKTVVLTLYPGDRATIETWTALSSDGVDRSDASYTIDTGHIRWYWLDGSLTFDDGQLPSLDVSWREDGVIIARWNSSATAYLETHGPNADPSQSMTPDMEMRPVFSSAARSRPVDVL
jgi:hypothetical protein